MYKNPEACAGHLYILQGTQYDVPPMRAGTSRINGTDGVSWRNVSPRLKQQFAKLVVCHKIGAAVSPWNMPELGWFLGYPFALSLMALTAGGMMFYFLRKGWFR